MRRTFEEDAIADVEREKYEAQMKAEAEVARAAAAEQKAAAKAAREKAALGSKKMLNAQRARSSGASGGVTMPAEVSARPQRSQLPSSRATGGGNSTRCMQHKRSTPRTAAAKV